MNFYLLSVLKQWRMEMNIYIYSYDYNKLINWLLLHKIKLSWSISYRWVNNRFFFFCKQVYWKISSKYINMNILIRSIHKRTNNRYAYSGMKVNKFLLHSRRFRETNEANNFLFSFHQNIARTFKTVFLRSENLKKNYHQ